MRRDKEMEMKVAKKLKYFLLDQQTSLNNGHALSRYIKNWEGGIWRSSGTQIPNLGQVSTPDLAFKYAVE